MDKADMALGPRGRYEVSWGARKPEARVNIDTSSLSEFRKVLAAQGRYVRSDKSSFSVVSNMFRYNANGSSKPLQTKTLNKEGKLHDDPSPRIDGYRIQASFHILNRIRASVRRQDRNRRSE